MRRFRLTEEERNPMPSKVLESVRKLQDRYQRSRDSSELRKQIVHSMELVGQHEANGLLAGHPYMQQIWADLDSTIQAYSKTWNVPVEKIFRENPALTLIQSKASVQSSGKTSVMVVAVLLSPVLVAAAHSIYVHVSHWLGG